MHSSTFAMLASRSKTPGRTSPLRVKHQSFAESNGGGGFYGNMKKKAYKVVTNENGQAIF